MDNRTKKENIMSYYGNDEISDMVNEARRYDTSEGIADGLRGAHIDATETHLPYIERVEEED